MKATFVEMTTFEKYRADYLVDDDYKDLQQELLANPHKGDTISGTGGLRKYGGRIKTAEKANGAAHGLFIISTMRGISSGCSLSMTKMK